MVYGRAGNKVTVQPGLLKSSIRKRRLKKKELNELGVSAGTAIYIGKGTKQKLYPRYWVFVEYGTSKLAPVPYLRPAFDTKANEAIERFKTKLRQNIENAGGIIIDSGGDS
jgi:HK97 gp10 family phage protein